MRVAERTSTIPSRDPPPGAYSPVRRDARSPLQPLDLFAGAPGGASRQGPSTPNSVERSATALHAARLQRNEGETTVEQMSERLQQALREGAERFLEVRRIGEAKAQLEDAQAACIRRFENFVATRGARSVKKLAFQLWACRRAPERTLLQLARRMPLRLQGTLMSQCMMAWLSVVRKNHRKTLFLVDSTTTHSIKCRLVFDGSIDGRSWRDARAFKHQLHADLSNALCHLSGLRLLSSVSLSFLLSPKAGEHLATQIKVGRVDIDDFSVEVTYLASKDPFSVSPDRLVEEMNDLIQSKSLRGPWSVFAIEHTEVSRTFVGIPRADAKRMRKVLKELWNDAFTSKGRQAAAMKRLYYSSSLLLAGAFRALQQGVKQARQQQASGGRVLGRIMRQELTAAFDNFRNAASHSRYMKCTCQRIIKRMQSSFTASALMHFQECVARGKEARKQLAAVIGCWRMQGLQKGFLRWMEHVGEQHDKRRVEKHMSERRELEGAHLAAQERNTAVELRLRHYANKAIMRMMLKRQSQAFRRFVDAARASMKVRRVLLRILRRDQSVAFETYWEAVNRSQELWQACRKLILHRHRSFMAAALLNFASAVAAAKDERSRITQTIARWKSPEVAAFFAWWVVFVDHHREIRRKAQEESTRRYLLGEQQQLRDELTAVGDLLRQRTRQTLLRIMKHHLATAFTELVIAVELSKRRRGKASAVLLRLMRMRLACSFRTLAQNVEFRRELRMSKEEEILRKNKGAQGHPVWYKHGSGIALGVKDRIQKQAQRTLQRAHLKFAFRHFCASIDASVHFVRQARKRIALARVLTIWQHFAISRRRSARLLRRAVLGLRRRRLRMWWNCWQKLEENIDADLSGDLSAIALDKSMMGNENTGWQTLKTQCAKMQEMLIARMLNSHLAHAFAAFMEGCAGLKTQRLAGYARNQKMRVVLRKLQGSALGKSLDSWLQCVHVARVQNQKMRVSIRRLKGSALGKALDCWLQYVEGQGRQEAQKGEAETAEDEDTSNLQFMGFQVLVLRRLCRLSQRARQALEVEFLKIHDRLEQQSRSGMTRMITRQLAVAFETLLEKTQHFKQQRHILEQRMLCCIQNSKISAAFEMLVAYVDRAKVMKCKMRCIVRKWRRSLIDMALDHWLQYVEDQRMLEQRILCCIQNSKISAAFEMLVAYVDRAKDMKCKMRCIVRKWRRSLIDMALDHWLQYVEDQRTEHEQACQKPRHDSSYDSTDVTAVTVMNDATAMATMRERKALVSALTAMATMRECKAQKMLLRRKQSTAALALIRWHEFSCEARLLKSRALKTVRRLLKSSVVLAWGRWVVMVEGAQHIKQERAEILCLVMERWRKILYESRSTRWTVLETAVEMALKSQNKAERELDTAERELELMRLATHQQPAAVALLFDVDFEDMFTDSAGLGSFIAQLQEDICFAMHIPRATVQVLLFKRGSMVSVAEVLLNKIIDHSYPGSGRTRTPSDIAEELVIQAADRESNFRRTAAGGLARSAEVHGAINGHVCIAVEKSLQLLLSKAHRPEGSWLSGFKCLGGNVRRYQRQHYFRGSHEPQMSPPGLLRGSTGTAVPDSNAYLTPTTAALPQTILSSRRRPAHQSASAVRGTDLHRELQTHAAVDWIAPDGQHGVVTSHVVFGDETWGTIDNSIFSSDDEDGMSLQSQRQDSQFRQHSSSLALRQTPQGVEEAFFSVSGRGLFFERPHRDDL